MSRRGTLQQRISQYLLIRKKLILERFSTMPEHKQLLFIVGCQRSGTTLMYRIFENDWNTRCFPETSSLNEFPDIMLRLKPFDEMKQVLDTVRKPFITVKPLVESQNILKILDYFEGSKAVWIYRNYKSVAASNLKFFGEENGITDLIPILNQDPRNWRSERVPEYVYKTIADHYSEDMNPFDAAVLFWCARNSLYLDLELDKNDDIYLCKYEDLVSTPEKIMRAIYNHSGQPFPGPHIHKEIHSKSVKRGKDLDISPGVEKLAQEIQSKIEEIYQAKNAE